MIWPQFLSANQPSSKAGVVTIDRREWLWVGLWTVVIVVVTNLPYAWGAYLSTPANQFSGFVIGVEDGYSYLAKMQEGRAGHWLFYLAYTPEPHPPALFFLFYLLLGKLSGLLNVDPRLVFALSRLVTVPFGLISFYCFAAYFTQNRSVRRWALLLFGLTAGLGWLWLLLGLPAALDQMPVDLWVPDASFFLSALTFPHLPLSLGLLLWVVIGGLRFIETGQWRWWLVGAGAGFLAGLIHPHKLVVLTAVFGGYCIWQSVQAKRITWTAAWRWALIVLPSLPYLVYVWLVFETNFAFRAWREQSLTWSPSPLLYLLGFGLILPLAGLGLWHGRRYGHFSFVSAWSLVVPFLLYIPLPLQRRFLDGYQAVLALLGAVGLVWLLDKVKPSRRRRLLVLILIPMTFTNLLLAFGAGVTINHRQPPVFVTADQRAAFAWLADQATGQIVLTDYQTGNLLPAFAPLKVFVGHGPETAQSTEKRKLVEQFFSTAVDDAWRQTLLSQYSLGYVVVESGQENVDLGQAPFLERAYQNNTLTIFEVITADDADR